eukprot:m51a1_g4096 hypothetical protein (405) ;mRNA; r:76132-77454
MGNGAPVPAAAPGNVMIASGKLASGKLAFPVRASPADPRLPASANPTTHPTTTSGKLLQSLGKGSAAAKVIKQRPPPPAPVAVTYPLEPCSLPVTPRGTHTAQIGACDVSRNVILVTQGPEMLRPVCAAVFGTVPPALESLPKDVKLFTGQTKTGTSLTVVTCGRGPTAAEAAIVELACAHELHVGTRQPRGSVTQRPPLHVVRVGTAVSAQTSHPPGSILAAVLALGVDSTAKFYEVPMPDSACEALEREAVQAVAQMVSPGSRFASSIIPYAARASPLLVREILNAAGELGVLQGRVPLTALVPTIPSAGDVFAGVGADVPAHNLSSGADEGVVALRTNAFDEETSVVLHICEALLYRAGSISVAVSGRGNESPLSETETTERLCRLSVIARNALEHLNGCE